MIGGKRNGAAAVSSGGRHAERACYCSRHAPRAVGAASSPCFLPSGRYGLVGIFLTIRRAPIDQQTDADQSDFSNFQPPDNSGERGTKRQIVFWIAIGILVWGIVLGFGDFIANHDCAGR